MSGSDAGRDEDAMPRGTRRGRRLRTAFYAGSTAVILWAGSVVPLPVVEYVPNTPTPIAPLIEIDGADTTELQGEAALLTILLRQQPTWASLGALVDDQRQLRWVTEVYAPGADRQQQLRLERQRFGRQFDIAAAVGAGAAGIETELVTEVVVVDVVPESSADGLLARGDVVVAVDGNPIVAAEELQEAALTSEVGQELVLTVRHAGQEREVPVTLGTLEGDDQPRLGVAIETALDELRLPIDISLAENTRIGGPSAGMMVALTVYDLLSEEDLLGGRTVMGTGTLDADGRVGFVGGVAEKMVAAAHAEADLVLVPAQQLEEARSNAPEDLRVVGVATLEEALEALRRDPV